eukprot:10203856-Alexandrium_andersonii.AAC.1
MIAASFDINLDAPDADDRLSELEQFQDVICSCVTHHVFPPTALGTRKAELSHRFHSCAHALRLESLSWHHASLLADSFISITGDMGTEMALNTIPQVPVADLFAHWCRLDPNYQDLALEFQGPVRPDGECMVSFAGAIYIPG